MFNTITNNASQAAITPVVFYSLLIWSVSWKGIALWKSARNKQIIWFIAILILNSVGVLEIIYVLFFQIDKSDPDWKSKNKINLPFVNKLKLRVTKGARYPLKTKKEE